MSDFIVAGTGSRALQTASRETKDAVVNLLQEELNRLREEHGEHLVVMSGMAEGFDKALAITAINMGIRLWCAVPNRGYGQYYWGRNSKTGQNRMAEFNTILGRAEQVTYVCAGVYHNGRHANFVRNDFMVGKGSFFLVWDPSSSGTRQCLESIQKAGKPHKILTLETPTPPTGMDEITRRRMQNELRDGMVEQPRRPDGPRMFMPADDSYRAWVSTWEVGDVVRVEATPLVDESVQELGELNEDEAHIFGCRDHIVELTFRMDWDEWIVTCLSHPGRHSGYVQVKDMWKASPADRPRHLRAV